MDPMLVNLRLGGCCVDSGRIFHFGRMVVCCCSCLLLMLLWAVVDTWSRYLDTWGTDCLTVSILCGFYEDRLAEGLSIAS